MAPGDGAKPTTAAASPAPEVTAAPTVAAASPAPSPPVAQATPTAGPRTSGPPPMRSVGMKLRGVNVDPMNPVAAPSPALLREHNINAVRLVSLRENLEYARRCQAENIYVLGLVAKESEGYVLERANAIEVGNEPDAPSSAVSSWSMTPDEYVRLWKECRKQDPGGYFISGGLLGGDPKWWREVAPQLDGVKGVALHLYWTPNPAETRRTVDDFASIRDPRAPVWVTEWHPQDSKDLLPLADLLAEITPLDFFFCWTDGMVPGLGLTGTDGKTIKPQYAAFKERSG